MSTNRNPLISATGAELRALVAAGDALAKAELDRRMAKRQAAGKVTVAALRSWGRTTEADSLVAHAKAEKAAQKAAKPAPKGDAAADKAMRSGKGVMGAMIAAVKADPAYLGTPAMKPKAVAFTRTNERVDLLTTRIASVEEAILKLGQSQASMYEALTLIGKKLGC